jgi:hypothetical protein
VSNLILHSTYFFTQNKEMGQTVQSPARTPTASSTFPREPMSRPTGAWQQQQQHPLHRGCMWAASPAFRRQLVLLRTLLPPHPAAGSSSSSTAGLPSSSLRVHAMATTVYEADAEAVIRRITPPLDRARHKGQAGERAAPALFLAIACLLSVFFLF